MEVRERRGERIERGREGECEGRKMGGEGDVESEVRIDKEGSKQSERVRRERN